MVCGLTQSCSQSHRRYHFPRVTPKPWIAKSIGFRRRFCLIWRDLFLASIAISIFEEPWPRTHLSLSVTWIDVVETWLAIVAKAPSLWYKKASPTAKASNVSFRLTSASAPPKAIMSSVSDFKPLLGASFSLQTSFRCLQAPADQSVGYGVVVGVLCSPILRGASVDTDSTRRWLLLRGRDARLDFFAIAFLGYLLFSC
jgi:hypothetical protein